MADELPILVNECIAGDQLSLGKLIRRFRGQVYGLCYRMLGQREDAEDAMQETFVRVANNLHRWDPERAFEPWLLTIAGNRCRTRLAQRMRRPGTLALDYPVADQSVDDHRAELLSEELDHALSTVRQEYRDAFVLFHKNEMRYKEISESLDIPLGTVKTWVHRARGELIMKLRTRGVLNETS